MGPDIYSRLEHLKLIQAVIGRMAQNSFTLKGWSVTLVSALIALAVNAKSSAYASLAFFPAVAFWGLDAYYLWQERRFRSFHIEVCEGKHSTYAMLTARGRFRDWLAALFRPA